MSDWMRKVLQSKLATRHRLRALSFSEKLKLLEKLRQRSLVIAQSPLRGRRHRQEDTMSGRVVPTEELRDFVAEDEEHPKSMLYPRDPSLDPQLVRKGKDEQDRKPLALQAGREH